MSDDDRITCNDCARFVRRQCTNAVGAGLSPTRRSVDIGPALASLKQRCQGYAPRKEPAA